jgi:hypothetical protein
MSEAALVFRDLTWPERGIEFYQLDGHLEGAISGPAQFCRPDMVPRIRVAYAETLKHYGGAIGSHWATFGKRARPVHDALVESDEATARVLADPLANGLFLGFQDWGLDKNIDDDEYRQWLLRVNYQLLVRLCEAVGAIPFWNPEGGCRGQPQRGPRRHAGSVESLLQALDLAIGTELSFPNPFPGEFGLKSKRGIISYRALHAIYQAWRLRQLDGDDVIEIGAGMGRTAYYAHLLGATNYTIIDLPMANIAQACFLTAALGHDLVAVYGEAETELFRIAPPMAPLGKYDIALNVDSIPEMTKDAARQYAHAISRNCQTFLSINMEIGWFKVSDLLGKPASRHPYWLRKGYVEELYLFQ